MNIVLIIAILVLLGGIGFIIWDRYNDKKKYETVLISYSEVVGSKIVEDQLQYIGLINRKHDLFKIGKLKLNLPIPPKETFIPTNMGKKKIYLIKLDAFRFGFRIPSLNNEVYIQSRDETGNPIKLAGKPVIKKHKWKYCDDVVEPDVKHWEENILEKLKQKHRTRSDMLSKWLAPIIVGMILVTGIVTIHMTTKYAGETLKEVSTHAKQATEEAEKNTGMIQNLIKRIDNKESGGG